MSYIDPKRLHLMCRICLTKSDPMIFLNSPISEANTLPILEVLEIVMGEKINISKYTPQHICKICLSLLTIAYELKMQYNKSKSTLLDNFSNIRLNEAPTTDTRKADVEVIYEGAKYSLNELLIVEKKNGEEVDKFDGFLNNLGKTVSIKFAANKDQESKTIGKIHHDISIQEISNKHDDGETVIILNELGNLSNDHLIVEVINDETSVLDDLSKIPPELLKDELIRDALTANRNVCGICGATYATRFRLTKHLKNEHGSSREIKNEIKKLQDDQITILGPENVPTTPQFEEKLSAKEVRRKMRKSVHMQLLCQICGHLSSSQSGASYHQLKHKGKMESCPLCSKKFYTPSKLKHHMDYTHQQNVGSELCSFCGRIFKSVQALRYHLKSRHKDEKNLSCSFCNMKFFVRSALNTHLRRHKNERIHPCNVCHKRFFSGSELIKHKYIHSGVKPYSCKYCDKKFTSSYNVKVHYMTHGGTFDCVYCEKNFVDDKTLAMHLKHKHHVTVQSNSDKEI